MPVPIVPLRLGRKDDRPAPLPGGRGPSLRDLWQAIVPLQQTELMRPLHHRSRTPSLID